MKTRDLLLGVLVAALWGLNFVVIDEGLAGIPPLFFAAIRFALVGLLALKIPRPACSWKYVVAVGLCMSAGQFGFLYLALAAGMPAGIASLVLQAQVPLTIVLASVAFRESVGPRKLVGVGLAIVGLVVVGMTHGSTVPVIGLALVLAAAASWAVGNVASRKAGASGLSMVIWSALVVPVPLLGLSAALEGPASWVTALHVWGWPQTLSTAYTVIVATVVGFGLWNTLLARYPASSVVPFALLVPVAGLLSAWLIQHQVPPAGTIAGGLVLIAGAALALATRKPAVASAPGRSEVWAVADRD